MALRGCAGRTNLQNYSTRVLPIRQLSVISRRPPLSLTSANYLDALGAFGSKRFSSFPGRLSDAFCQPGIHQGAFKPNLFLQKGLHLRPSLMPGRLQLALHLLQAPAQMDPPQGPDRALHALGGKFLLLFHQDRRQRRRSLLGGGNSMTSVLPAPPSSRDSISDSRGQPFVEALALQGKARLARWIEFFFGAIAGGKMCFAGLHLRGGGQRPDQDASPHR